MSKSFTAQIDSWVLQTKQRMEAVLKASAQDVIEESRTPVAKGGNMPVDTGFLRNSLVATIGSPTTTATYADGTAGGGQNYAAVIAAWNVNDTLYAMYTANYAVHVHYGSNGRVGRQFVTLAAQNWQSIVRRNALALRNSSRPLAA